MPSPFLTYPQLWAWLAIALAAGFLVWLLSPILAPFLFAAILAYIFDPLVERLTRRRVPRTLAVVLVLLLVLATLVALLLVVLPVFYKELRLLMAKMPAFIAWFNAHVETGRSLVREMLGENEGQLLVVAIVSVYYVSALSIARLDFAFPVGVITGLAVIIPYVGVVIGLVLATIAALFVGLRHLRAAYLAGPLYGRK